MPSLSRRQPALDVVPARVTGARGVGVSLFGSLAVSAVASAAVAVGAVAIGRLAIGKAVVKALEAEDVRIGKLSVRELEIDGQRWPSPAA